MTCTRCNGRILADLSGERSCLQCGFDPAPIVVLPRVAPRFDRSNHTRVRTVGRAKGASDADIDAQILRGQTTDTITVALRVSSTRVTARRKALRAQAEAIEWEWAEV